MQSARILKEKINSGKPTLGVLCTMHFWLDMIEICMNAGLDYLIIDHEHHAFDSVLVADACALGRRLDFPILIRPPETSTQHVRLAADKGACGFLLPTVQSAAHLDEVRDGLYMPPRGKRRPGGPGNRWIKDFNYPTWVSEVENDFVVLPQIESREGLKNADAIAQHELTTAIAVGPYDLSANLGVCWNPEAPELKEALAHIRAAGQRAGKNMWMIGDGSKLRQQGFSFLCITEPVLLMEGTLKQLAGKVREGEAARASDTPLP